jgi:phosphatidylethanolamine-binding protein
MGEMIETVSFGPEGDQWYYDRGTKEYDLTRGGSKKFTVKTTKGRENTSVTINPELTALVIVDMQNAFLDAKLSDHPRGLATIEPSLAVIDKCREIGIQVS